VKGTSSAQATLAIDDDVEAAKDQSTSEAEEFVRQAEAEVVAAEARAAAARARVRELRKLGDIDDQDDAADPGASEAISVARKRRRWRWPRRATVLAVIALTTTCALFVVGGFLLWQHQQADREQQRRAEFAAAAEQAVVTLMSIDSSKAQEDVQRIIDNSTGQFHDDFKNSATDFVDVATASKAVTKASALAAAVQSMTRDSAVVLVTANTTISNSAGADKQPRTWRLSVEVVRDGDQIKMSKVDFVP
jgi:Mce-associated membrane protein